jgi:uncharacterized protein YbjT (DUF2867 family)
VRANHVADERTTMTILVTGATGTVGRSTVKRLLEEGSRVRAVTRRPSPGLPSGVEVVSDASNLTGVSAVFVHPRALGAQGAADLVERAKRSDVERIVALSAVNVDEPDARQPSRIRGDRNREVERAVVESGIPSVALRCDVFMTNALGTIAPQLRRGDVVRWPYPDAHEAMVDERDVGEVAAVALSGAITRPRLELTGPASLSLIERVAIIGDIVGRRLTVEAVDIDTAVRMLTAAGLPESFARSYLQLQEESVGFPPHVSADIPIVLGRPARGFGDWARDAAEAFQ